MGTLFRTGLRVVPLVWNSATNVSSLFTNTLLRLVPRVFGNLEPQSTSSPRSTWAKGEQPGGGVTG